MTARAKQTATKATETPWRLEIDREVRTWIYTIRSGGGENHEIARINEFRESREADADLIVRAVNSHAALVAACEFALKYSALKNEKGRKAGFPSQLEGSLRAALALAQGGAE